MKKILNDNYQSIVNRGLISDKTTLKDFISKLDEEVLELKESNNQKEFNEELADIILVCLNIATHYKIDIESELKNKIQINKRR